MNNLELGAFSVSLSVKDLEASRSFYEKIGFTEVGGGPNYLIMRNRMCIIGLFHGMFEGNVLTFNPGLSSATGRPGPPLEAWRVDEFTDVREIQRTLQAQGVPLATEIDEEQNPDGPASLAFLDPDDNAILIDQFFDRPE